MANIPITPGSGSASVAAETIGGISYQQIQVVGSGGNAIASVNSDGTLNVRISGSVATTGTAAANQSVSGTVGASIIGLTPVAVTNTPTVLASMVSVVPTNFDFQDRSGFTDGTTHAAAVGGVFNQTMASPSSGSFAVFRMSQGRGLHTVNVDINGSVQGTVAFPTAVSIVGAPPFIQSGTVISSISGGQVSVFQSGTWQTSVFGSVTAIQGTNPWIITSSIAGGIFPISGSVAATITNTNINVSGSVVAFLGNSTNASVITVGTAAANQSVSGTVGASIIGIPPVNITQLAGNSINQSGGSPIVLLASSNASVITAAQGSVAVAIVSGSISATFTPPANQSVSGTVTALQLAGSTLAVSGSFSPAGNQSVSGAVTAPAGSIMSISTGTNSGGADNNSTNQTMGLAAGGAAGGLLVYPAVFNGVNWDRLRGNSSVGGFVNLTGSASVPASSILVGVTANTNGSTLTTLGYTNTLLQITSGPGASITAQMNFEGTLDGTQYVPLQGYNLSNGSISSVTGSEGNWSFNTAGLQNMRVRVSNWTVGSITARVVPTPMDARPYAINAIQSGNSSSSVFQAGTWSVSVLTGVITSIATAGQVMGSVAALQATNPWNIAGSVAAFVVGSSSIITRFADSSILSVPVGSTITLIQANSVAGTYSEDTAHTSGDRGLLSLNVRNDTLASVTSNDGDYGALALGPAGEAIVANSPLTKWVSGTASMLGGTPVNGGSVTVIAAQGSSVFTYITGIQIANPSANNIWIKFEGATSSTLAFTMAPANGGSNIYFQNGIKTNANGGFTASVSGVASIYVSAQGFISKT